MISLKVSKRSLAFVLSTLILSSATTAFAMDTGAGDDSAERPASSRPTTASAASPHKNGNSSFPSYETTTDSRMRVTQHRQLFESAGATKGMSAEEIKIRKTRGHAALTFQGVGEELIKALTASLQTLNPHHKTMAASVSGDKVMEELEATFSLTQAYLAKMQQALSVLFDAEAEKEEADTRAAEEKQRKLAEAEIARLQQEQQEAEALATAQREEEERIVREKAARAEERERAIREAEETLRKEQEEKLAALREKMEREEHEKELTTLQAKEHASSSAQKQKLARDAQLKREKEEADKALRDKQARKEALEKKRKSLLSSKASA